MPSKIQQHEEKQENNRLKEWTIMVFCAGDNALSPMIVSQLKDLKDAGPHEDVNVLVYFDANENGVPTRIYSINKKGNNGHRRNGHRRNGHLRRFGDFVHNLASDNVEIDPDVEGSPAETLRRALEKPDAIEAGDALSMFLAYCQQKYKARHYAVLLVGHGMIVANDAFLPDESPASSITLKQLGKTIKGFGGKLELLALHSCSMSAVEVAYELKGKANYMIASEGPAYVQGWPYRKLLQRTFELVNKGNGHKANGHLANGQNGNGKGNGKKEPNQLDVRELTEKLYRLASSNGLDFMLSGYSQDLALINLQKEKFTKLTRAMRRLVIQLKAALNKKSEVPKHLIQLAHLESQSYFNESYTDLYDFCLCLSKYCGTDNLMALKAACVNVMGVLEPNKSEDIEERFDKIVVHSTHFGSLYQHSHGLSIYFPWTKPLGDAKGSALGRYDKYKFTTAFKDNSWKSFLDLYLHKTLREARDEKVSRALNKAGVGVGELSGDHKTSGASGPACSCISIKNFRTTERVVKGKCRRMGTPTMSPELKERDQ
jgi:hypothetical protein